MNVEHWDIVEVTEHNNVALGYEHNTIGLMVQCDGAYEYDAIDLSHARELIESEVGHRIRLRRAVNSTSGQRWEVEDARIDEPRSGRSVK